MMAREEPQKLSKVTHEASSIPPPTENAPLRRRSLLCVMMRYSLDARWTRATLILALLGVISSSVAGMTPDRNVTPGPSSSCPKACSCINDVVNCSGASLDRVPVIPDSSAKTWILDGNRISYIGRDSFGSFDRPSIEHLSLRNNNLSSLDSDAFRHLPHLRDLYLDWNRISSIHPDAFKNASSHLETLSLVHTSIGVMELDWAFLRPLVALKKLDVSDTVIAYLRRVPLAFSGLAALEELTMQRMDLNITTAYFETVETLEIRTVDLSFGTLENVDEDAFQPLGHLRNLVLENVLVSSKVCQNMFYGLANGSLERINMQGVFIYKDYPVEADLFRHLRHSKVRELNFAGNYVGLRGRIPNKLFHPLKSLRKLHLDDCDLVSIHEETFHGLHDLKVLTLRRNLLSCVKESDCGFLSPPSSASPHHSRHPMRHLETIDLSDNLISEAENRFQLNASFPALASLNLRRNRLNWIPVGMFGDLKKLVRLDLSENPIEGIEPEALSSLESLAHLELDGCRQLTRIRQDVLAGLNQLTSLSVRNGGLAHIHRGAFANFSQLEELRLRGNRLGKDHNAMTKIFIQKSKLKVLDLGENDLESFPRGLLSNSFHLRRLHLDSNRLSDCRSLVQSSPEALAQLEDLDLSHNSLVDPSPSCFESLKNLKTIDLSSNPFYCSCRTQDLSTWLQQNHYLSKTPPTGATTEYLCAAPGSLAGRSVFALRLSSYDCYWKFGVTSAVLVCLLVTSVVVIVCLCLRQTRRSSRQGASSVCAAGGFSPSPSAGAAMSTGAAGAAEEEAVGPGCSIFSKSSSSAPYAPLDEEELTVREGGGGGGSDGRQQADGFGRPGSTVIPSGGGGGGDAGAAATRNATANKKSAKQNGFSRAKTRSLHPQQQQQQQQRSGASSQDEAAMQIRALVEDLASANCTHADDDDDDPLCHAGPCFVTTRSASDADHVEDTV